jgi:hypothetical protein
MKKTSICAALIAIGIQMLSCKKFIDLKPISSATEETFYTNEKALQAGIIAAYDALQNSGMYGSSMLTLAEVRADNVNDNNPGANGGVSYQIESFSETSSSSILADCWLATYRTIYRCNIILDHADKINMDGTIKNQIKGQALFIRSLCYFNLIRLWGKVPLITTVQSTEQARMNKRAEIADINAQMIVDLNFAKDNLPPSWPDAQHGKAVSYAAAALLGKIYLYQKQYGLAANTLKPIVDVINSKTVLSLVPQPNTFPGALKTSKDIIFAVQYLLGGVGESVNQNNRYRNQDNNFMIVIPQSLFDNADNRRALVAQTSNGSRPLKFNSPQVNNETSGDFPIIRCAEVMLLYAEALNGSLPAPNVSALNALNAVRLNAGIEALSLISVPTKDDFQNAIYTERRLELALECDRWFDILRTGQMPVIYPLVSLNRMLYPVPQAEIDNITDRAGWQNTGYN